MASQQIEIANSIREAKNEIADKCAQDSTFRQSLLDNPAATIEEEYGMQPGSLEGVSVNVVVEEPNSIGIMIPPDLSEMELSDDQLDQVSGGAAFVVCCPGPILQPMPKIPGFPSRGGRKGGHGW